VAAMNIQQGQETRIMIWMQPEELERRMRDAEDNFFEECLKLQQRHELAKWALKADGVDVSSCTFNEVINKVMGRDPGTPVTEPLAKAAPADLALAKTFAGELVSRHGKHCAALQLSVGHGQVLLETLATHRRRLDQLGYLIERVKKSQRLMSSVPASAARH
jgi:hypothetical protein